MLDITPRPSALRLPADAVEEAEVLASGLRRALETARASAQPMAVLWGAEFRILLNDACRDVIGDSHPFVAGQPVAVAWCALWEAAAHRMELALRGEASVMKAVTVEASRAGKRERPVYDLTFTPLLGEAGITGGVLCAFTLLAGPAPIA